MKENKCWLCLRVTPQQVAKFVHRLPFPDGKKHVVTTEASEWIRNAYHKNPIFFCGKTPYRIIGGLLYILGFKYCNPKMTMLKIAHNAEGILSKSSTNIVTLRGGYRDWLKLFPELKQLIWDYDRRKRVSDYKCPLCSETDKSLYGWRTHLYILHDITGLHNIRQKDFTDTGTLKNKYWIERIRLLREIKK